MINSLVLGVGSALPDKCLTNDDLSKTVDTSDEWIVQRTGIRQRFVLDSNCGISLLAEKAARRAIVNAKLNPQDIDFIIVATTTADKTFPSTAAIVQDKLGITNGAAAFDVNAVCSGFIYALSIADTFIKSGQIKHALIIGADAMSKIIDWKDRSTCVLFGDGAGAMVLGGNRTNDQLGVLATSIFCDGRFSKILETSGGTSTTGESGVIIMNGREVFKQAIDKMVASINDILEKAGLKLDQVDLIIPHQANQRILDAIAERLGIDSQKILSTMGQYANTSAATIPISWNHGIRTGAIKDEQTIVLTAMGAGVTWGAAVIRT